MFIKCNCVDRLAGNEKKPPLCFKDLHKTQRQQGQDKACGIFSFPDT